MTHWRVWIVAGIATAAGIGCGRDPELPARVGAMSFFVTGARTGTHAYLSADCFATD